ncbi:MAG: class I SAM-dependent methyltransferase, partial [Candidatus Lutacidiplasmatales archaeon]
LLFTVALRLLKWRLAGVQKSRFGSVEERLDLLGVAARNAPTGGLWLEFGVFRGESLNFLALRFDERLYGFDSFEGLPTRWGIEYKAGSFSTAGAVPEVGTNVTLVRGLFSDTLPPFLNVHPDGAVSFLHIDSDLYDSARVVLEALRPRIRVGTVIVFDEYCGALPDDEARAFREFIRSSRVRFEYLGSSLEAGSVAVRISA